MIDLEYILYLFLSFLAPFLGVLILACVIFLPVGLLIRFCRFVLKRISLKKKEETQATSSQDAFRSSSLSDFPFSDIGKLGESYTYDALLPLEGYKRFLSNCYIPKDDNSFTEIDLILIHKSGIYVLESKNYSGWIFGNENQVQWIQSLPLKPGLSKKTSFLNPVIQNRVHIKWLRKFLDIPIDFPIYSYIVFSDRCELKDVTLFSNDYVVVNRKDLFLKICQHAELVGNKLSDSEIDTFYKRLYPLTQVTEEQKLLHIQTIEQKKHSNTKPITSSSSSPASEPVSVASAEQRKCPRCGGALVLRTAKKGERAGKQFWGCSNFPKCRYIENIDISTS